MTREQINERTRKIDKETGNYIKFLRTAASESLIDSCVRAFCDEKDGEKPYRQMLEGNYEGGLLANSDLRDESSRANLLSMKYVYGSRSKIVNEQGGYQIVRYFLDVFSSAIEDWHENKGTKHLTNRSRNLLMILHKIYNLEEMNKTSKSEQRDGVLALNNIKPVPHYRKLIDFISGMTDDYAIELAAKLRGTDFGLI